MKFFLVIFVYVPMWLVIFFFGGGGIVKVWKLVGIKHQISLEGLWTKIWIVKLKALTMTISCCSTMHISFYCVTCMNYCLRWYTKLLIVHNLFFQYFYVIFTSYPRNELKCNWVFVILWTLFLWIPKMLLLYLCYKTFILPNFRVLYLVLKNFLTNFSCGLFFNLEMLIMAPSSSFDVSYCYSKWRWIYMNVVFEGFVKQIVFSTL